MKKSQNKKIAVFTFCLLAFVGTYNAVMINAETSISDSHNLGHLDHAYGPIKVGRNLAVSTDWRKVSTTAKVDLDQNTKVVQAPVASAPEAFVPEATIKEELQMSLVEVINPKKWAKGVTAQQFKGAIETNHGIIESLQATLPEGMNIDIAFTEMNGNTFEYDLNGEIYSGMMYQVDQSAYMVTLTNGPLEGTRLRFAGENKDSELQKQQTEAYLAETHNVEVQEFGSEEVAPEAPASENASVQATEVPAFNFNI